MPSGRKTNHQQQQDGLKGLEDRRRGGGAASIDLRQAAAVGYSRPHLSGYYNIWIPLLPGSTFTPERQTREEKKGLCAHVWHVRVSYTLLYCSSMRVEIIRVKRKVELGLAEYHSNCLILRPTGIINKYNHAFLKKKTNYWAIFTL